MEEAPAGAPSAPPRTPLVGVLAMQGDFAAHRRVLEGLRARVREVRVAHDLDGLDGLVIPGGESTTMTLGIEREGLAKPLRKLAGRDPEAEEAASEGIPIFGSCAGLIMLDRKHLGIMDVRTERNAFGRQLRSFEADIDVKGLAGGPLRGVFIRAPWIAEHGADVEILAEVDGHPVAARQGHVTAVAFHTELGSDDRLHRLFLADVFASAGLDGANYTPEDPPGAPAIDADVAGKDAPGEDAEDGIASAL